MIHFKVLLALTALIIFVQANDITVIVDNGGNNVIEDDKPKFISVRLSDRPNSGCSVTLGSQVLSWSIQANDGSRQFLDRRTISFNSGNFKQPRTVRLRAANVLDQSMNGRYVKMTMTFTLTCGSVTKTQTHEFDRKVVSGSGGHGNVGV